MAFILSPPRAFHSIGDFPLPDASKFDTDESVFYEKDGEMLVVCKEDKGIEGRYELNIMGKSDEGNNVWFGCESHGGLPECCETVMSALHKKIADYEYKINEMRRVLETVAEAMTGNGALAEKVRRNASDRKCSSLYEENM